MAGAGLGLCRGPLLPHRPGRAGLSAVALPHACFQLHCCNACSGLTEGSSLAGPSVHVTLSVLQKHDACAYYNPRIPTKFLGETPCENSSACWEWESGDMFRSRTVGLHPLSPHGVELCSPAGPALLLIWGAARGGW